MLTVLSALPSTWLTEIAAGNRRTDTMPRLLALAVLEMRAMDDLPHYDGIPPLSDSDHAGAER